MDSLRWMLLGLGVMVIAGVYAWTRWQAAREDRQYRSMLSRDPDADPLVDAPHEAGSRYKPEASPGVQYTDAQMDDELDALDRAIRDENSVDPLSGNIESGLSTGADVEPESAQVSANDPALVPHDEKLLVLYLVANRTVPFRGKALRKSFGKAGLEFGDMDIYHRTTTGGTPVFSVANLVEPGTFSPEDMDASETRGISLFMRLPGPVPSLSAFDDFSDTAWKLAKQLGGELRDESRRIVTRQSLDQMRESLAAFEHRQQVV